MRMTRTVTWTASTTTGRERGRCFLSLFISCSLWQFGAQAPGYVTQLHPPLGEWLAVVAGHGPARLLRSCC